MTQESYMLDRYKLGDMLGEGASSYVIEGEDIVSGETVAVKLFKGSRLEDFRSEVNAYLSIGPSVHIPKLLHYSTSCFKGSTKQVSYIALEYAKSDLFAYFEGKGVVSLSEAKNLLLQIAQGLKAIHEAGFTHRDIKFENVFIDGNFNLKLGDLAYACKHEQVHGSPFRGTKGYRAPETIGDDKFDPEKADIFSCGVIFYIMITSRPPFFDATPSDSFYKHIWAGAFDEFWKSHRVQLEQPVKEFVQSVLAFDPILRPTIDEIINFCIN